MALSEHQQKNVAEWEFVNDPSAYPPDADVTERLKVPGGWIYRNVHYSLADLEKDADQPAQVVAVAMCFVPETR